MKRSEFRERMGSMWDLHDFCVENDCEILGEMYDEYSFSEEIDNRLMDYARNDGWRDLLDRLRDFEDLTDRYDLIVFDPDDYEFVGVDESDFDRYYRDILEWADDQDVWEPEDDEEYDEEEEEDESFTEEEPEEEPDFWDAFNDPDCSFDDLCASGVECVSAVRNRAAREQQNGDAAFDDFMTLDF